MEDVDALFDQAYEPPNGLATAFIVVFCPAQIVGLLALKVGVTLTVTVDTAGTAGHPFAV